MYNICIYTHEDDDDEFSETQADRPETLPAPSAHHRPLVEGGFSPIFFFFRTITLSRTWFKYVPRRGHTFPLCPRGRRTHPSYHPQTPYIGIMRVCTHRHHNICIFLYIRKWKYILCACGWCRFFNFENGKLISRRNRTFSRSRYAVRLIIFVVIIIINNIIIIILYISCVRNPAQTEFTVFRLLRNVFWLEHGV